MTTRQSTHQDADDFLLLFAVVLRYRHSDEVTFTLSSLSLYKYYMEFLPPPQESTKLLCRLVEKFCLHMKYLMVRRRRLLEVSYFTCDVCTCPLLGNVAGWVLDVDVAGTVGRLAAQSWLGCV